MNFREWFQLFKKSLSEWQDDKALKLGAALSYYTVFSRTRVRGRGSTRLNPALGVLLVPDPLLRG